MTVWQGLKKLALNMVMEKNLESESLRTGPYRAKSSHNRVTRALKYKYRLDCVTGAWKHAKSNMTWLILHVFKWISHWRELNHCHVHSYSRKSWKSMSRAGVLYVLTTMNRWPGLAFILKQPWQCDRGLKTCKTNRDHVTGLQNWRKWPWSVSGPWKPANTTLTVWTGHENWKKSMIDPSNGQMLHKLNQM